MKGNQYPASWLTGAGDPDRIQQRYNQLRDQGLNHNQAAEQLRKEGIQLD